jgi:Na+-transporting NADH:ubiquinone oxidoreductase subunit NqrB
VSTHDPRYYQIVVLGSLLTYGVGWLDFGVGWDRIAVLLATALLTQLLCTRLWGLTSYDARSPLISALSLCLLLRTNDPALAVLAAVVTISSKFLIRVDGKHIFNPTNLGLVVSMAMSNGVWVSPGQWGNVAYFGFLLACVGSVVVNRAARSDVTYAFLGFYVATVVLRGLWLGDPLVIALHHLQNGAILLFAFFMISDPKTTPDSRMGRVIFALLVALGAAFIQFGLFRTNGLLWSLVVCSATVPLINRWRPGPRYRWSAPASRSVPIDVNPLVAAR